MLGRITDFASSPRGKWVTLIVWLVVAGLLISQLPRLSDVRENEAALFLPADAESTRAYEFARERFPSAGTPVLIVVREPDGLRAPSFAAAAGLADWLTGPGAPDNVIQVRAPDPGDPGSPLVSPDRTTLYVLADIAGEPAEPPFIDTVDAIRDRTAALDLPGVEVARTGPVITSAGLILAGTFSALMLLPLQDLMQLGFAVATGVLIDTFVTRTLIVPALVKVVGRWNWWPSGVGGGG